MMMIIYPAIKRSQAQVFLSKILHCKAGWMY